MKHAVKTITILLTLFFVTPAIAGDIHDPGVNKRQRNQKKRIVQGMRSGELTAREAGRLRKEQAKIRREERRFKSDGMLTERERVKLHRDLNRSSKHIYRQKHDRQHR